MVSGFVTSPDDHSRICLGDASPMRIASKSLMSINVMPFVQKSCSSLLGLFQLERGVLVLEVVLLVFFSRQVVFVQLLGELLVVRQRQLAVGVDPVGALLELLCLGIPRRGPAGDRPQVDAELLGSPQQLVVLLAYGHV